MKIIDISGFQHPVVFSKQRGVPTPDQHVLNAPTRYWSGKKIFVNPDIKIVNVSVPTVTLPREYIRQNKYTIVPPKGNISYTCCPKILLQKEYKKSKRKFLITPPKIFFYLKITSAQERDIVTPAIITLFPLEIGSSFDKTVPRYHPKQLILKAKGASHNHPVVKFSPSNKRIVKLPARDAIGCVSENTQFVEALRTKLRLKGLTKVSVCQIVKLIQDKLQFDSGPLRKNLNRRSEGNEFALSQFVEALRSKLRLKGITRESVCEIEKFVMDKITPHSKPHRKKLIRHTMGTGYSHQQFVEAICLKLRQKGLTNESLVEIEDFIANVLPSDSRHPQKNPIRYSVVNVSSKEHFVEAIISKLRLKGLTKEALIEIEGFLVSEYPLVPKCFQKRSARSYSDTVYSASQVVHSILSKRRQKIFTLKSVSEQDDNRNIIPNVNEMVHSNKLLLLQGQPNVKKTTNIYPIYGLRNPLYHGIRRSMTTRSLHASSALGSRLHPFHSLLSSSSVPFTSGYPFHSLSTRLDSIKFSYKNLLHPESENDQLKRSRTLGWVLIRALKDKHDKKKDRKKFFGTASNISWLMSFSPLNPSFSTTPKISTLKKHNDAAAPIEKTKASAAQQKVALFIPQNVIGAIGSYGWNYNIEQKASVLHSNSKYSAKMVKIDRCAVPPAQLKAADLPPNPPIELQAHTTASGRLILSWKPPKDGTPPVSYKVYYDSSLSQLAGIVEAGKRLSFEDCNLSTGIGRSFFIVSVSNTGKISSSPATIEFS